MSGDDGLIGADLRAEICPHFLSIMFTFTLKNVLKKSLHRTFENTDFTGEQSLFMGLPSSLDGIVGDPFNYTLVVFGGSTPYIFSIFSGSLPAGLSLNSSTGEITGTPTIIEIQSITFRVTDNDSNTFDALTSLSVTGSVSIDNILLETGDNILLETGDLILLE